MARASFFLHPASAGWALPDVFVVGSANSGTAGGSCKGEACVLAADRDSRGEQCSFKFDLKSGRSTR